MAQQKKTTKTRKTQKVVEARKRNWPAICLGGGLFIALVVLGVETAFLFCPHLDYEYPTGVTAEQEKVFDKAVMHIVKTNRREASLDSAIDAFVGEQLRGSYDYSKIALDYQVLDYGVNGENNFFIQYRFNRLNPEGEEITQVGTMYFWEDAAQPGKYSYAYSYDE